MDHLDLTSSVPDWLIEYPVLLRVFEELQIDYCCGGKSLEFACRERGIEPDLVLQRLRRVVNED